jgi:predicted transcriptional regulator
MTGTTPPLEIFKERQGPASEELLAYVKATNKRKAAVKKALKEGPLTVPEVAEATSFDPQDVLWTLTAMRKYGQVVEEGVDGDYPRYALPEKEVKR